MLWNRSYSYSRDSKFESRSHTFLLEAQKHMKIRPLYDRIVVKRIETEAEMMGQNATSKLDYYDYGATIKIELPK